MDPSQIIIIGLIASALTFGLRILANQFNVHPSRVGLNVALYVVSAVLAVFWTAVTFPMFPPFGGDVAVFVGALWQWVNALVLLAAPIMGSATLIYNLLYEKVVVPVWARFGR